MAGACEEYSFFIFASCEPLTKMIIHFHIQGLTNDKGGYVTTQLHAFIESVKRLILGFGLTQDKTHPAPHH